MKIDSIPEIEVMTREAMIRECVANAEELVDIEKQAEDRCEEGTATYAEWQSFENFKMTETGLYHESRGTMNLVCQSFKVLGRARDKDSACWGTLLEWQDRDGISQTGVIPDQDLHRDRPAFIPDLASRGFRISTEASARKLLLKYLNEIECPHRIRTTNRNGWFDDQTFVLGESVLGGHENEIIQNTAAKVTDYVSEGSLEDWKNNIAKYAVGNPLLTFAISASFMGPLLNSVKVEAGGFHFFGQSSRGKTTLLAASASVWGRADTQNHIKSWRTTDNAAESIAETHNDNVLYLDEMGQATAQVVSDMAYMLANGRGKSRARRDATLRVPKEFRVGFLSTGEVRLKDKIAQNPNQRAMAGQEVRLVDIPADLGNNTNMLVTLHGYSAPGALADHIKKAATTSYGTAGRAFLDALIVDQDAHINYARRVMEAFIDRHCPSEADPQVKRAAMRFALVAAGGELAIKMSILPWKKTEAFNAAKVAFGAWLQSRETLGAGDVEEGIKRVRYNIEKYGDSRFDHVSNLSESVHSHASERYGYQWKNNSGDTIYGIPTEVFKTSILRGFNVKAVCDEMIARNILIPATDGKPNRVKKIEGKSMRLYCISDRIISTNDVA